MPLRVSAKLFIIALSFLFLGCVEEVLFDTKREPGQLVVSGGITARPGPYTLQIGRTTKENTLPRPVSGARVSLIDGDSNREDHVETEAGTYILAGEQVRGERGQSYHIEIELPNGKLYKSVPEIIPEVAGKDSAYFEFGTIEEQSTSGGTVEKPAIHAFVDTQIPPHDEPRFFRWIVMNSYAFK